MRNPCEAVGVGLQ